MAQFILVLLNEDKGQFFSNPSIALLCFDLPSPNRRNAPLEIICRSPEDEKADISTNYSSAHRVKREV